MLFSGMKKCTSYKSLLPALLLFALAAPVHAQNIKKQLDTYYHTKGAFNGNVLVAEKGKVIYQASFGYARFEDKKPNTAYTQFQLASIAKTFTALAVAQLWEQGKIDIDKTYAAYFPAFPYPEITIRQLLSHSSGYSDQQLGQCNSIYQKKHNIEVMTNADEVPAVAEAKIKLELQPGEKWWYSNMGYDLLALLVEKASGEPFNTYLKKHIWEPAGMNATYARNTLLNNGPNPDYAENYDYPQTYEAQRIRLTDGKSGYFKSVLVGASNNVSTTGDFFKFDRALKAGKLLKPATLIAATTPAKLSNGEPVRIWLDIGGMGKAFDSMGWFIFEDESMGKVVWHTGGTPGCATIFFRNLSKDQLVVAFDNTNGEKLYRKGLNAMRILNGKEPLPIKLSLTKAYAKILYKDGKTAAEDFLNKHKTDTAAYILAENDMNNIGYEFMEHGHLPQALVMLELNTRLYPQSDNVFNSYGDALKANGDKAGAIAMYRKSLEINPKNEDSINALKAINGQP